MQERAAEPQRGLSLGARITLCALAAAALLVGVGVASMLDGHPATNSRIAWVIWGAGLLACAGVFAGTRPRRVIALLPAGVLGVLLAAALAFSVAWYPSSLTTEEAFDRPRAPLTLTRVDAGASSAADDARDAPGEGF